VPVIVGLPAGMSEDQLKAIGAGAASSGSVAMFHAVGNTPEAPTLEDALGGRQPLRTVMVGPAELRAARDELTTSDTDRIGAVCVGTPHDSGAEFRRLVELLDDRHVAPAMQFFASTGREVLTEIELRGWADRLRSCGITIVTDTCTYITPILAEVDGAAMTDSAKWAYYAPGNIGVDVVFGSIEDCVATAVAGRLVRDEPMWADA